MGYDTSCNTCTTSTGKPIRKYIHLRDLMEKSIIKTASNNTMPDVSGYVLRLQAFIRSQPLFKELDNLLEEIEN